MKIIRSPRKISDALSRLRRKGRKIGFVPTMGALHEGHLSLVRAARRENDIVVVSIFVNPAQFGPQEDLKKYPRPFRGDCRKLRAQKTDFIFAPLAPDMYPESFSTFVSVRNPQLTNVLCGKFRPGHFDGVATVVAKLLNLVQPDRVYFGAKDYQQSVVVARLIEDLNFNVRLRRLPTVRDRDGLAMSSRNQYLNAREREKALALPQVLAWVRHEIRSTRRPLRQIRKTALRRLRASLDRVDYLEIVDPKSLQPLRSRQPEMVAAAAAFAGKTRLIDNAIIKTH